MQSPRIELVFGLGSAIKRITAGVKAPPLTVSSLEFRSVEGLHPPGIFKLERKKNTAVCRHPQTHSFCGLAGILPYNDRNRPLLTNGDYASRWISIRRDQILSRISETPFAPRTAV
jgi:hypothetical protein